MLFNKVSPSLQTFNSLINPELLSNIRPKGQFLRLEYPAQSLTEYMKEVILASNFSYGAKEDAEDDYRVTSFKWATVSETE